LRQEVYDKAEVLTADLLASPVDALNKITMEHCLADATASVKGSYRDTKHHIPWFWILGILAALITAWNVWI